MPAPSWAQRVLVLGASGSIGQATVQALAQQGHRVTALYRHSSAPQAQPQGAQALCHDLSNPQAWREVFSEQRFDAVISCMASRTGNPEDAWRVDHDLHVQALQAAQDGGVQHFVLLSALCVQKPRLAFQHAKLAFEQQLRTSGLKHAIVRPTAYFKSLSGQAQRVSRGQPFLLFGDGQLTACKPISDRDLGRYLATCLTEGDRLNRVLPIGGPGPVITPREQGLALFDLMQRPPHFKRVPVAMMDAVVAGLRGASRIWPRLKPKAELAQIGRYYATESMLVWDPVRQRYDADATPSFGEETLFKAYAQWLKDGEWPQRREHAVF